MTQNAARLTSCEHRSISCSKRVAIASVRVVDVLCLITRVQRHTSVDFTFPGVISIECVIHAVLSLMPRVPWLYIGQLLSQTQCHRGVTWRPESQQSRTLNMTINSCQRHGAISRVTHSRTSYPPLSRSYCRRVHVTRAMSRRVAWTSFELRCNSIPSTLPSRQLSRCSSRLPPEPCCSSHRSRSGQYFYPALGWRCPDSSHVLWLHLQRGPVWHITSALAIQELKMRASCLDANFTAKPLNPAERSGTFQHMVLSLPAFTFGSQYGAASQRTSCTSPAMKNRFVPAPRNKPGTPLQISSHSRRILVEDGWLSETTTFHHFPSPQCHGVFIQLWHAHRWTCQRARPRPWQRLLRRRQHWQCSWPSTTDVFLVEQVEARRVHLRTGGLLSPWLHSLPWERCGEWPPPVPLRSTSAHVATMSGVVAPFSAARSPSQRGQPSWPPTWVRPQDTCVVLEVCVCCGGALSGVW